MIELLLIAGGIFGAGMGGMWVKTRRRTNKGNTRAAVGKFDAAADKVSAAQARWYDLQIEAPIIAGGLEGEERAKVERAEAKARKTSGTLYDTWLPVSDVDGDAVASYNDESRQTVTEHKHKALAIVARFEEDLDALESLLDQHRG